MPSLKEDHYEPAVLLHVEERIDDVVGHWVVLELRDLEEVILRQEPLRSAVQGAESSPQPLDAVLADYDVIQRKTFYIKRN